MRTPRTPHVAHLAVALVLTAALAGCVGGPDGDPGDPAPEGDAGNATGYGTGYDATPNTTGYRGGDGPGEEPGAGAGSAGPDETVGGPHVPDPYAPVVVYVDTVPHEGFQQVWVTVERVELHERGAEAGWATLSNAAVRLDLHAYPRSEDARAYLGGTEVLHGSYDRVRVNISAAIGVRDDGTRVPVDVTREDGTAFLDLGVKPGNGTTRVLVTLDVANSLHPVPGTDAWELALATAGANATVVPDDARRSRPAQVSDGNATAYGGGGSGGNTTGYGS